MGDGHCRPLTSTACIPAPAPRRESAKSKRKRKGDEDDKLRKAIDIYHLAGSFFPSRVMTTEATSSNSNSSSTASARANAPPQVAEDELFSGTADDPASTSLSVSSRPEPTLDEMLDAMICSTIKPSGSSMYGHHDRIQQKTVKMKTAQVVLDKELQGSANSADWDLRGLHSSAQDSERAQSHAAHLLGSLAWRHSPPSDAKLPGALPPIEDREAVKRYIAATAHAAQASNNALFGNRIIDEALNNRSARVRDALYGTVYGSHPGLEVVRERASLGAVREMAERLEEEEDGAKGESDDVQATRS